MEAIAAVHLGTNNPSKAKVYYEKTLKEIDSQSLVSVSGLALSEYIMVCGGYNMK